MTDVHSHIMYGVDDGSKSIEESIILLDKLKSVGFDNVILTPHYIAGDVYVASNKEKFEKFAVIDKELKSRNIDINIYLGNEIFISNNIVRDINEERSCTLNGTKYLLFEIPFHNQIINLSDIIYEIKLQGYVPILAHPERYSYFQKNYHLVDSFKEEGLLFQANFSSILGYYGNEAKKLLKYMLKHRYVDYLGTDIHRTSDLFVVEHFDKIEKKFYKVAGKDYYQEILFNNDNLIK